MKLAFSTIGCPDWSWSDIYVTAKDLKFDGIEVRGVENEMYVPKIKAFDDKHIQKNLERLQAGGIEISILTSGIVITDDESTILQQFKEYLQLAEKLSCKYIRVLISPNPQPEETNIQKALNIYGKMCEMGEKYGVTPLIETNGVLADSKEAKKFIEDINSNNKGILWDIHHPYRFFNESAEETWENIGKYVKYVHVKDSVVRDGEICYRMIGYGDVPVFDVIKLLNEKEYSGFVSLEWVKRWNPNLEEPGIVFAHFMSYIMLLFENI